MSIGGWIADCSNPSYFPPKLAALLEAELCPECDDFCGGTCALDGEGEW